MREKALEYYNLGNSCSESIILAAIDEGLCDKSLYSVATAFSGGMGSGCLCGAVSGSQMLLGCLYGKDNSRGNEVIARAKAKEFIEEFKKNHKATCCRFLSAGLEGAEKRQNCAKLVCDCAEILDNMMCQKV